MSSEQRRYQRKSAFGNLLVQSSRSGMSYTAFIKDISMSGAFIHSAHVPNSGEKISFKFLDEFGLGMANGQGKVVRIFESEQAKPRGFAVHFDVQMDQTMFDYLRPVHLEEIL